MAKKEKTKLNYGTELRQLKEQGPERIYLLYGEEDYLRERFLDEIRNITLKDGVDFNYKRLDGSALDLGELSQAVDSVPFFSRYTLVEVRDYDINKCRESDAERLKAILSDVPDYCTVVFVLSVGCEPDGRLSGVKTIKKYGKIMEFSPQEQDALIKWVTNRFYALGKSISRADAEYLIFVSGTLMNRLIPEIEKIASHSSSPTVTRADISSTAQHIPEADVFELTDMISQGKYDKAASLMSDLLADKNNSPIFLLALIGQQMRRLYAVRLASAGGCSKSSAMELAGVKFDFIYTRLTQSAKRYSPSQLADIVDMCAKYDYLMKSSGEDNEVLLKDFVMRLAAGI